MYIYTRKALRTPLVAIVSQRLWINVIRGRRHGLESEEGADVLAS